MKDEILDFFAAYETAEAMSFDEQNEFRLSQMKRILNEVCSDIIMDLKSREQKIEAAKKLLIERRDTLIKDQQNHKATVVSEILELKRIKDEYPKLQWQYKQLNESIAEARDTKRSLEHEIYTKQKSIAEMKPVEVYPELVLQYKKKELIRSRWTSTESIHKKIWNPNPQYPAQKTLELDIQPYVDKACKIEIARLRKEQQDKFLCTPNEASSIIRNSEIILGHVSKFMESIGHQKDLTLVKALEFMAANINDCSGEIMKQYKKKFKFKTDYAEEQFECGVRELNKVIKEEKEALLKDTKEQCEQLVAKTEEQCAARRLLSAGIPGLAVPIEIIRAKRNWEPLEGEKRYNYVYRIHYPSTGMEYIGKHSTNTWDDGYLGSGAELELMLKEDRNEAIKEILYMGSSEKEVYYAESIILGTPGYIEHPRSYNKVISRWYDSEGTDKELWDSIVQNIIPAKQK